jgi:hypothetical protein
VAALVVTVLLTACSNYSSPAISANQNESQQQGADSQRLEYVIPIPNFPFSQIRQDLVEVEAIQALGIQSTTFGFMPGNFTHPVWSCPSLGLPIPVTDQLSNPSQILPDPNNTYSTNNPGSVIIPQEDPNGIYQGDSTGTNVLCLDSAGVPYDHYNEGYDDTVTATAHWDGTTGQIVVTGAPVMPVCKVKILNAAKHKAEETCVK